MESLAIPIVLWDANNIQAYGVTATSDDPTQLYGFLMPVSVQRSKGVYETLSPAYSGVLSAGMFLYFRLLPLVRTIFTQAGYTLDTDIESVPGYVPDFISMPVFRPGIGVFDRMQSYAESSYMTINDSFFPKDLLTDIASSTFRYGEIEVHTLHDADQTDPENPLPLTTGYTYTATGYMNVRIRLSAQSQSYSADQVGRVRFRIQKYGNLAPIGERPASNDPQYDQNVMEVIDTTTTTADGGLTWLSEPIELAPMERIYVEVRLLSGMVGAAYRATFETVFIPEDNNVFPGCYITPDLSTLFSNQLEVIKLFVQLYGLMIQVDSDSKMVRAYNFNRIADRAESGDYYDWSNKLDIRPGSETLFDLGTYAQSNRIAFTKNDLLGLQNYGIFTVDNKILPVTKDLFSLPIESSQNTTLFFPGQVVPGVPYQVELDTDIRYSQDDGRAWNYTWVHPSTYNGNIPLVVGKDSKAHIVRAVDSVPTSLLQVYNIANASETPDTILTNPKLPVSVDPQIYVDVYYPIMADRVLNPARVVTALFYLTPVDVENIDLLRPVYVEAFKDFFYIQKINNYSANELTEVTLVCLNIAENGN
jgi:hypothetical protein